MEKSHRLDLVFNKNILEKDKEISEMLISKHEETLSINKIYDLNFSKAKDKIISVINREIENIKKTNINLSNETESKVVILEQKIEQLNLINNKDEFKEELKLDGV